MDTLTLIIQELKKLPEEQLLEVQREIERIQMEGKGVSSNYATTNKTS